MTRLAIDVANATGRMLSWVIVIVSGRRDIRAPPRSANVFRRGIYRSVTRSGSADASAAARSALGG